MTGSTSDPPQWMESASSHNAADLRGHLAAARDPRKTTALPSAPLAESPITSPPYWAHSHARSVSNVSVESMQSGAIRLLDNTEGSAPGYDKQSHCWAKGVHIDDFVIINGTSLVNGLGSFVVWNVTIETLNGGKFHIRKRYSEFDDLRNKLLMTFPLSEGAMPPLPPKGVISKFRPKFLEHRRIGLSYFLNCILLNPEFSGSPVLKEFLFES